MAAAAAAAAKSLQSFPTLCDPIDGSPPGSLGFSRQEHWSGLPFPSPMHESEKWKWSRSLCPTLSDPMDCSLPGSSVHGFSRQEYWSRVPLPSPNIHGSNHNIKYIKVTFCTYSELHSTYICVYIYIHMEWNVWGLCDQAGCYGAFPEQTPPPYPPL